MRVTGCGNAFADPGFHAAMLEMAALGLRVTEQPQPDSTPFGVLAGNAGARWFLLPIRPRAVCRGSLALIQPLRRVPRTLRNVSGRVLGAGMAPAMLRRRVHVAGSNRLAGAWGARGAYYAYLTGTAGPHRKLVVQCMDRGGNVLGYAKVSRTPAVHALLANEAATLHALHATAWRSAIVPRVLRHAVQAGTAVLATDTVAGAWGPRPFRLQSLHLAFLDELAARMPHAVDGATLLDGWQSQVHGIANRLSATWQARLASALRSLAPQAALIAPRGWAHGDFTPVNCFPRGDRLFVFDWEYAGPAYPADFDLIRFLDASMHVRPRAATVQVAAILHELTRTLGRSEAQARARLAAYACARALRGAVRQPTGGDTPLQWRSQRDDATMLDVLLSRPLPDSARKRHRLHATPAADAVHAQHPSGVA